MAYTADGVARRPVAGGFFAGLREAFRCARMERRTYNELMSLSDRELNDLGLGRGDIADIARKSARGF